MIAKLNRDKNPDIKELIQKIEDTQAANEDASTNLRQEKEKRDTLVMEKIEITENLKVGEENKTELDEKTAAIKAEIDKLTEEIK